MNAKRNDLLLRAASVALGSVCLCTFAANARADVIWEGPSGSGGGTGSWSTAADWSTGTSPTGTTATPYSNGAIYIDQGQSANSVVTYDETALTDSAGALVISSGDTLTATTTEGSLYLDKGPDSNGTGTTLGTTGAGTGLNNAGAIIFSGLSGKSWLIALGGDGNQAAVYSTNTGIIENTGTGAFTLTQNPGAEGILNTNGTIANTSTGTMYLGGSPGSGLKITNGVVSNAGTLLSGGNTNILGLTGVAFTNTGTATYLQNPGGAAGGTQYFTAGGASSIANSGTMTINFNGGATATAGSIQFEIGSGGADTSSLSNTHTITVENTATLTTGTSASTAQFQINTTGAIDNDGTINIITVPTNQASASINIGEATTIGNSGSNTGSIVFNDNAYNYIGVIGTLTTHPSFTLGSGQTLSGAAIIGDNSVNFANGVTTYALGNITNNGIITNGSAVTNPLAIVTAPGYTFTNSSTATLHVSGAAGVTISSNTTTSNAGIIKVDNARTLSSAGAITFTAGSYAVQIDSDTLGDGQIVVGNTLVLGTGVASLSVTDVGNTTLTGQVFTIINADSVSGDFSNLPTDGSTIVVDGTGGAVNTFRISYDTSGGNGDEVTLTSVVPEPGTAALMMLASIGLLRRRRTRALA